MSAWYVSAQLSKASSSPCLLCGDIAMARIAQTAFHRVQFNAHNKHRPDWGASKDSRQIRLMRVRRQLTTSSRILKLPEHSSLFVPHLGDG